MNSEMDWWGSGLDQSNLFTEEETHLVEIFILEKSISSLRNLFQEEETHLKEVYFMLKKSVLS